MAAPAAAIGLTAEQIVAEQMIGATIVATAWQERLYLDS